MLEINLEEKYISTNGIRLHTVMAGPLSGRPVILLHGFPDFWRGWIKQLPAFVNAGFRVIIPDQRGYNLSDKPKGVKAYCINELVNDVTGLIDALDYEKVNLIGHDWGAIVAWVAGIWKPERIHRLGILNVPHPAVMNRFLRSDLEQIRRSWYAGFFQLPWLPEKSIATNDWRGGVRSLRGSGKLHSFANDEIVEYKNAWSKPGAITAMINWYRAAFLYRPRLHKNLRVRVPTLMLWGVKDIALSHRMARPSLEYCEDGNLIFFPDASHWVHRDEAESVNSYLVDFISK